MQPSKHKFSIRRIPLVLTAAAALCACTANYEDMNRHPFEVDRDAMGRDDYNITSALVSLQNNVISTSVNTCQFTDCLLGGTWGGYFADSKVDWNSGKFSTYNAPNNWILVLFNDIIPQVYSSLNELESATEDEVPLAIGRILKVAAMHRITDTYGPIPYSQIGTDGKLEVRYDSQEHIYESFFSELDDAISALTARQTDRISADADKIYGGEVRSWILFANSLKLRLAMRLSEVAPETARTRAAEAFGHEIGVFTANAQNAALNVFGEKGNPICAAAAYNGDTSTTGGDHHASADITSYMNGLNDPRREAYFKKSTFTGKPYVGLRSGIAIPAPKVAFQYAGINLSSTSPLQWMNAAEAAFLRAEYELRWGDLQQARTWYETGIRLSFEQWGVEGADAYIADNTHKPEIYADPEEVYSSKVAMSDITVAWDDHADTEVNLERIITQKWIANYTLGLEAWAERRRTGYPRLLPVVENGSGGTLANGDCPRRLPYPVEEYQTNGTNVNAAVSEWLGGKDDMATRVWWDCKTDKQAAK